jgi:F420-dependent oxidoreductase-like protein
VSGPQVSEGWHGVRFAKPLARTREYVDIVKLAMSREKVRYDGETYQLPLPDGPGKALHLMVHPVREHIPIYLASVGPKNLELTGEIADGWLAVFFAPKFAGEVLNHIEAGRAKVGKTMEGFDVVPTVPLVVGEDIEECAKAVRPYAALYVGGMGSREQNFYNALAVRMGYQREAAQVQDRYLARDYDGAAALVPAEFVDQTSLLGPLERIAERMVDFAAAGVTTLSVSPFGATMDERLHALRVARQALDLSGTGS